MTLCTAAAPNTDSTARVSRTQDRFGKHGYSEEELIAEIGSAFLCARCRIEARTLKNSSAHIQHWLGKLKSNPQLLVEAASQAQKASDYILRH